MPQKLYLAGNFIETAETIQVINPYNDEIVAQVCLASEPELELAITQAVKAFQITRKLEPYEKAQILDKIVQGLRQQSEKLAETMVAEVGKPLKHAQAEVTRTIDTFTLARNAALEPRGDFISLAITERGRGYQCLVKRFPLGPVAGIAPFNFPLNLVAHKLAPAIAAGCPIVLKPASKTPLTALLLAEIVHESGWPAGALSVLPCSREVGNKLSTDERFKLLSFTGSPAVGWQLKKQAGKKRVVLELGGNAAVYIHPDADLQTTARKCALGAFSSAGQSCISVQRIYAHESIYEKFKSDLISETAKLKVGDPKDLNTDVGPLITPQDADRIESWIKEAAKTGANILSGGKKLPNNIIEPAIIENPPQTAKVSCLEAFGPLVTLRKVPSFEQGLNAINDSDFGLQAGIFTRDITLAHQAFENLEVGGVTINEVPTFRIDNMPYGGIKDSGFGREGIKYAIADMTELKIMII